MLDIYNYQCPNAYLRDWIEAKKKVQRSFTLRALCKKLELRSHASLSLVLNGERHISKQILPKLVELIQFDEQEARYFETLIDYKKSKKDSSRLYYGKKLGEINPKKENVFFEHTQALIAFSNPISILILELIQLSDLSYDPNYIVAKSAIKTDKFEVTECLDTLLELGIIYYDKKNYLRTKHKNISTPDEVKSLMIQNFHTKICQIAQNAVKEVDYKDRFFSSIALRFNKDEMKRAQEMIDQFIVKFSKEFEADPKLTSEIFQFNFQFFPITKFTTSTEVQNENKYH
jgi:uncharacterized protein (TIGR02147 family)